MFIASTYDGLVYRCVPRAATEPLSGAFSMKAGARWNPPGSFPALYTFTSRSLARSFAMSRVAQAGVRLDEIAPERLPDLVVIQCAVANMADVASDAGLQTLSLPTTYPRGFETGESWVSTQPVGVQVIGEGAIGILTRSATATSWTGPFAEWGEVVLFTDVAPEPKLVDRVAFQDWVA